MIAFYECSSYSPNNTEYYRWRKWCALNEHKRAKLISRLKIAIISRDKVLEIDLQKQIKKIDQSRFK